MLACMLLSDQVQVYRDRNTLKQMIVFRFMLNLYKIVDKPLLSEYDSNQAWLFRSFTHNKNELDRATSLEVSQILQNLQAWESVKSYRSRLRDVLPVPCQSPKFTILVK